MSIRATSASMSIRPTTASMSIRGARSPSTSSASTTTGATPSIVRCVVATSAPPASPRTRRPSSASGRSAWPAASAAARTPGRLSANRTAPTPTPTPNVAGAHADARDARGDAQGRVAREDDRVARTGARPVGVRDDLPADLASFVPLVGHDGGIYSSRRRRTVARKRSCRRASPDSSGWKLIASTAPCARGDRMTVDRGEHLDARPVLGDPAARG